jgi:hypothetical protein
MEHLPRSRSRLENRICEKKLGPRRVLRNTAQKRRLATAAARVGRKLLQDCATFFSRETLLRWHRTQVARKYDTRRKSTFVKAHLQSLAACDFFTVEAWTPKGLTRFLVFFAIDVSSRKVQIAGIDEAPDEEWMLQQALVCSPEMVPPDMRVFNRPLGQKELSMKGKKHTPPEQIIAMSSRSKRGKARIVLQQGKGLMVQAPIKNYRAHEFSLQDSERLFQAQSPPGKALRCTVVVPESGNSQRLGNGCSQCRNAGVVHQ